MEEALVEVAYWGVVLGNVEGFAMAGKRFVVAAWFRVRLGCRTKSPCERE